MACIRFNTVAQGCCSHEAKNSSLPKLGFSTLRMPSLQIRDNKNLKLVSTAGSRRILVRASLSPVAQEHSALVRESWKILKKDAGAHAAAFFLKVFEIAPTVKQLFSFMRDSTVPAEKNPHLKAHALVVFTMTCEAAVLLGEDPTLATLRPKLLEMGQSHVVHQVVDEHFDVVKYALLETLRDALKDEWSPEMKTAWAQAYDAVTLIIKDEMRAVRSKA